MGAVLKGRVPLLTRLREKVQRLPAPIACQNTVGTALTVAIQNWQADPEVVNNSLVVLGRPMENVPAILKASLAEGFEEFNVQFFLGGYQRPRNPLDIQPHLHEKLGREKPEREKPSVDKENESTASTYPTIVVVPRLEQCFLRCIQGWEAIEYMQDLTTRDTSRFWVFGCNHWAWIFLDRVCQVSAYLEQPQPLPVLSGEDLKEWLLPFYSDVLTTVNLEQIVSSEQTEQSESESVLKLDAGADGYWAQLSTLSSGIGATAARLWLASLEIQATEQTETALLSPVKPVLPALIPLEVIDRYLLHSLMIHGEITRSHLAHSLGEPERKIRDRLQILRREGVILQRGRRLSVNPAHYPKLYTELENNNFLVGDF